MTELHEVIVQSADAGLQHQQPNGSMPAGKNGPYGDQETPVRNTSHWILSFLKAYDITENDKFLTAADRCSEYLLSNDARPHGKTFYHRNTANKDFCNGLIGQAWTIEALSAASDSLGVPALQDTAEEVFLLHPFDDNLGLWRVVEIDGQIFDYDKTFNHQLWFAASASTLQTKKSHSRVNKFLDNIDQNIRLYSDGLIFHGLSRRFSFEDIMRFVAYPSNYQLYFSKLKDIARRFHPNINRFDELRCKSIGYHSFNTYAFAILKENLPTHDFWKSPIMEKILKYSSSKSYKKNIIGNKYGYPYNPPGLENAYTIEVFDNDSTDELRRWLNSQFEKTLNRESWLMNRATPDPKTSAARIYESIRLSNYYLEFDNRTDQ